MTEDLLDSLKQIYGMSGIPVVITDENLEIIWRSKSAEADKKLFPDNSAAFLFEHAKPAVGTVCGTSQNGTVLRFNVMKFENGMSASPCYIIEHIGSDELKDLLRSPDVRNYFSYICSRIRESAGAIAVSADEIDSAVMYLSDGKENVTESLNRIYKNMMLILREVINPEQVYYTLDPYCSDSVICLEDEIKRAADDAARSLGKTSFVDAAPEKGVYIRMNRSVLETIIADMTSVCCEGELFPDEIIFSSERTASERARITVRSINTTGRKNSSAPKNYYMKNSAKLYADYLCDVLCKKYGAVFTQKNHSDGIEYSMETEALPAGSRIVLNGDAFGIRNERFSPMTLSLASHHLEKQYKCITVNNTNK